MSRLVDKNLDFVTIVESEQEEEDMNHPLYGKWETELKPGDKLVKKGGACPQCGERREEELHHSYEDDPTVDCATCGCVFIPKGGR